MFAVHSEPLGIEAQLDRFDDFVGFWIDSRHGPVAVVRDADGVAADRNAPRAFADLDDCARSIRPRIETPDRRVLPHRYPDGVEAEGGVTRNVPHLDRRRVTAHGVDPEQRIVHGQGDPRSSTPEADLERKLVVVEPIRPRELQRRQLPSFDGGRAELRDPERPSAHFRKRLEELGVVRKRDPVDGVERSPGRSASPRRRQR